MAHILILMIDMKAMKSPLADIELLLKLHNVKANRYLQKVKREGLSWV